VLLPNTGRSEVTGRTMHAVSSTSHASGKSGGGGIGRNALAGGLPGGGHSGRDGIVPAALPQLERTSA
jgi:hypothetical protein